MQLSDAINKIKSRDFIFEISIPGKITLGKQTIAQAEAIDGTLENYFTRIAKANNAENIGIQLFSKNGTSHLRKDFFLVPINTNVDTSTLVSTEQKPSLNGLEPEIKKADMSTITKADLENATIKLELQYLKKDNQRLEERNKELEKKNTELHGEHLKVVRESALSKDQHDLEFQKKLLELEQGKKSGLNGLMGDIKEMPPEAWQMIAGLIAPNSPLAKGQLLGASKDAVTEETATIKHPDESAQECIDTINSLLIEQQPEAVGAISMMVEKFCQEPKVLGFIYSKMFPATSKVTEENKTEEKKEETKTETQKTPNF